MKSESGTITNRETRQANLPRDGRDEHGIPPTNLGYVPGFPEQREPAYWRSAGAAAVLGSNASRFQSLFFGVNGKYR